MEDKSSMKLLFSRKLKNGNWIVLAAGSEPLVIDEELADNLLQGADIEKKIDKETLEILKESGFYADTGKNDILIPEEKKNLKWKILRCGLLTVGALASLIVLIVAIFIGVPLGNQIISNEVSLGVSVVYAVIFAGGTTVFHELMHIVFARTWNGYFKGLHLNMRNATAVVSMTHIWVWSLLGRVCAISAGVIIDLVLLACLSVVKLFYENWIIISGISILWLRILWQFRFHKNCDGRLLIMTILDNPLADINEKNLDNTVYHKEIHIWKRLKIIGIIVDVVILVLWILPFVFKICSYILGKYYI